MVWSKKYFYHYLMVFTTEGRVITQVKPRYSATLAEGKQSFKFSPMFYLHCPNHHTGEEIALKDVVKVSKERLPNMYGIHINFDNTSVGLLTTHDEGKNAVDKVFYVSTNDVLKIASDTTRFIALSLGDLDKLVIHDAKLLANDSARKLPATDFDILSKVFVD